MPHQFIPFLNTNQTDSVVQLHQSLKCRMCFLWQITTWLSQNIAVPLLLGSLGSRRISMYAIFLNYIKPGDSWDEWLIFYAQKSFQKIKLGHSDSSYSRSIISLIYILVSPARFFCFTSTLLQVSGKSPSLLTKPCKLLHVSILCGKNKICFSIRHSISIRHSMIETFDIFIIVS